jgi:hypothetical protein
LIIIDNIEFCHSILFLTVTLKKRVVQVASCTCFCFSCQNFHQIPSNFSNIIWLLSFNRFGHFLNFYAIVLKYIIITEDIDLCYLSTFIIDYWIFLTRKMFNVDYLVFMINWPNAQNVFFGQSPFYLFCKSTSVQYIVVSRQILAVFCIKLL